MSRYIAKYINLKKVKTTYILERREYSLYMELEKGTHRINTAYAPQQRRLQT